MQTYESIAIGARAQAVQTDVIAIGSDASATKH